MLMAGLLVGGGAGATPAAAKKKLIPAVVAEGTYGYGMPPEQEFVKLDPRTLRQVGHSASLGKDFLGFSRAVESRDGSRLALLTYHLLQFIDPSVPTLTGSLAGGLDSNGAVPYFSGPWIWPTPNRLVGLGLGGEVLAIDPTIPALVARWDSGSSSVIDAVVGKRRLVVAEESGLGSPLRLVSYGTDGPKASLTLGLIRSGVETGRWRGLPPLARRAVEVSRQALAESVGVTRSETETLAITPGYWSEPFPPPDSSCGPRQDRIGASVGSTVAGYAIVLRARGERFRYHVFLHGPAALCARDPDATASPLPANNLLNAPAGTSYGYRIVPSDVDGRVLVLTLDGRVARANPSSGRLDYIVLPRALGPPGTRLIGTGWLGRGRIALQVSRQRSGGIVVVDLRARTVRSVLRDPLNCQWLQPAPGLALVYGPSGQKACRGLSAYDASGKLRFKLFRTRSILEAQVSGGLAYVRPRPTSDEIFAAERTPIWIVELSSGRVLGMVHPKRPIRLLPLP
jgi:hypothetical protein